VSTPAHPSLDVIDLHKSFGSLTALNGVTFSVRPGEIFGFVGSNGAGKTTTMRIILGVLQADSGEVHCAGTPITTAVRKRIGYMPEERGLYPKMKVGDQLAYLARLHGCSTAEATELTQKWTERLGIADRRDDVVEKLSLGNQQRVQLAAALMHNPLVLVLDEPFSGLDPIAVDVMSSVLTEIADSGVPVLFSSHQLDLVEQLSTRVGIIKAGQMIAVGTVDDLRGNAHRQFLLRTATPLPDSWHSATPEVAVTALPEPLHYLVDLGDQLPERVLTDIVSSTPVIEFTQRRPRLSELYKEVISQ